MLRDFLDDILNAIDSESLTDLEFTGLGEVDEDYSQNTYDELKATLEAREGLSTQVERLASYFKAKGLAVANDTVTPQSKLFVGAVLE